MPVQFIVNLKNGLNLNRRNLISFHSPTLEKEVNMFNDEQMKLRQQTLSILLKNFDDNRAIYECADEWTSKFKTTSGLVKYYKTYFAK